MKTLTVEEINAKLAPAQFKIVGEYKNYNDKTHYIHEPCGNPVYDKYDNMVKRLKSKKPCEKCHNRRSVKNRAIKLDGLDEKIEKIEKERNFTCLNKNEYSGTKCKLKWKCNNCGNDKIQTDWGNTLHHGSGCSKCNKKTSELICIHLIEKIYPGYNFHTVRPKFLLFEKDNPLELDGYNEELKLAIEYNGIQHYKFTEHFHRGGVEDLNYQIKKDKFKEEKCKEQGICLITIPYTMEDPDEIKEFIYTNSIEHVRAIKPDIQPDEDFLTNGTIDNNAIKSTSVEKKTKEINNHIEEKGYEILSKNNITGFRNKFLVRCPVGHHFETTSDNYKNKKRGCRYCTKVKRYMLKYLQHNMQLNGIPIEIQYIRYTIDSKGVTITYKCQLCEKVHDCKTSEFETNFVNDKKLCSCDCWSVNPMTKELITDELAAEILGQCINHDNFVKFKNAIKADKKPENDYLKVLKVTKFGKKELAENAEKTKKKSKLSPKEQVFNQIKWQCKECSETFEKYYSEFATRYYTTSFPRCCYNPECNFRLMKAANKTKKSLTKLVKERKYNCVVNNKNNYVITYQCGECDHTDELLKITMENALACDESKFCPNPDCEYYNSGYQTEE